jgi:hypothetical protein
MSPRLRILMLIGGDSVGVVLTQDLLCVEKLLQ